MNNVKQERKWGNTIKNYLNLKNYYHILPMVTIAIIFQSGEKISINKINTTNYVTTKNKLNFCITIS